MININDPKTNSLYDILPVIMEKENGENVLEYASSVKIKNISSVRSYESQNEFGKTEAFTWVFLNKSILSVVANKLEGIVENKKYIFLNSKFYS